MTVQSSRWDAFNPYAYVAENYMTMHDEDRLILDLILPLIQREISDSCRVLDIGTGPNLYPVIALLPYSSRIDCLEYARSNVQYLRNQIHKPAVCWHRFHRYMQLNNDRYYFPLQRVLTDKVSVRRGDFFLESLVDYDVVTMFFCAESITNRRDTFVEACIKSVSSVRPGGVYIAAFMEQSTGYCVDHMQFPAYSTNVQDLRHIYDPLCTDLRVVHIQKAKKPLREGYGGMVLVTGRRRKTPRYNRKERRGFELAIPCGLAAGTPIRESLKKSTRTSVSRRNCVISLSAARVFHPSGGRHARR